MSFKRRKTILFLGDGMADEGIAELNGLTPLQAVNGAAMNRIAAEGRSGTMLTLPEGYPTSSDVANMSVLGCDLATEICGRGPLEAASRGIKLGPDDICFRVNLVTVDPQGIMRDYSGGQVSKDVAEESIDLLNAHLGNDEIRFYTGVSYRNLLVLSGKRFSDAVACEKPDDHHGDVYAGLLPKAKSVAGNETVAVLHDLIAKASVLLKGRTANAIWPWSGGRAGAIHNINKRYGIRAAVISAVDVINGLGRCMGMDVINVPGATGYIDTNFEGKADAAIAAINDYDFVYVHVEAIDEVSHAQNLKLKMQAIRDFDQRLVGRVINALGNSVNYAVLPDHPVPLRCGKHTRTPVPVSVWRGDWTPDNVKQYNEISCRNGSLGELKGRELMDLLLGV